MKDNAECGLIVAKQLLAPDNIFYSYLFREATSVALRSNKVFMTQAVKINSFVFTEAAGGLRRDIDLALVACGGAGGSRLVKENHLFDNMGKNAYNDELNFLQTVFLNAKSKVTDHDGFTKGFLLGMSNHAGRDCNLSMLANGAETSLALKKKIAEYVGVANGKQLHMLQNAVENLKNL